MVNRLVSVGDDFTLPPAVKAEDVNLPDRLQVGELNATYAPVSLSAIVDTKVDNARADILARLAVRPSIPGVHPAPPTVTYSGSATLWAGAAYGASSTSVTLLGTRGTYDAPTGKTFTGGGTVGLEFYVTAADVEVVWACQASDAEKVWVWVDDQPTTAAPVYPLTTVTGNYYTAKLAFGSVGRRKVTFYANRINAFINVYTAATGLVEPALRRPTVAFIGDSFFDYTGAIASGIDAAPFPTALMLGAECVQLGIGGSGYVAGGAGASFGSTSRVLSVEKTDPDLIVVSGSVNDDGQAGIQSAAAATYAALEVACPGVPVVVFGPQPTNATNTISANRSTNIAAVKAACDAAPNVIAFHDRVGTLTGVPAAWSVGATYADGALVTYQGSVYRFRNGGVSGNSDNPRTALRWELVTWEYTGTGMVGTTTGDGTRDLLLHSDGVHPTAAAATADAARMATTIRADLAS